MAVYKLDDGRVLDTDKATQSWEEKTRFNGNNHISVNTNSQWEHETLYRSAKGNYYIEHSSAYQGRLDFVTECSREEAAAWLLLNEEELPEELAGLADEIAE